MSFHDAPDDYDPEDELDDLADAQGVTRDPYVEYQALYQDRHPFRDFWHKAIAEKNLSQNTREKYERQLQDWVDWMREEAGRHPALPHKAHVEDYIEHLRTRMTDDSAQSNLRLVARAFDWFAQEDAMPSHQPDSNIIRHVMSETDWEDEDSPEYPSLDKSDVIEFVHDVDHIRDRAIIVLGLKTGMRAGTLANVELQDLHLSNRLHDHYDELGTHPEIVEHDWKECLHIPADRKGTKSENSRTLPLDDETRGVLTRYLLIRPDNDETALFLTTDKHEPMDYRPITDVWRKHVAPRFDTDRYRSVTSHYARHFFTDFFGVERDWNIHLVQWMRGDSINLDADWTDTSANSNARVTDYLHPEYSDIESSYREEIFSLNLS